MKKIKSMIRLFLNGIRRNLFKDKRVQKKLSVIYHNLFALFDFKVSYDTELFDYKKILNGKSHFKSKELYYGNTLYGMDKVLKRYAHYNKPLNCCIEHGVYFGNYVSESEAVDSGLNGLLTFGNHRMKQLKGIADVDVVPIGPYIYYAQPLLSKEEIIEWKKNNGKTLLVFPMHSIDRVDVEFDSKRFIDKIHSIVKEKNIDTVMVCIFYQDIINGKDKEYLKHGFKVVCCGYRCDPVFLRRLKTFILLSDYTMSNEVGTHLGYCVLYNKPHFLYRQSSKFIPNIKADMENIQSETRDSRVEDYRDVETVFDCLTDKVTEEQKKKVEWYWGTNYLRSRTEMQEIFEGFER